MFGFSTKQAKALKQLVEQSGDDGFMRIGMGLGKVHHKTAAVLRDSGLITITEDAEHGRIATITEEGRKAASLFSAQPELPTG